MSSRALGLRAVPDSAAIAMTAQSSSAVPVRRALDSYWIVIALSLGAILVAAAFRIQESGALPVVANALDRSTAPAEWPAPPPVVVTPPPSATVIAPPPSALRAARPAMPHSGKGKARAAASAKVDDVRVAGTKPDEPRDVVTKTDGERALDTLRQAQLERPF
jgi:hypothetical protein